MSEAKCRRNAALLDVMEAFEVADEGFDAAAKVADQVASFEAPGGASSESHMMIIDGFELLNKHFLGGVYSSLSSLRN